MQWVFYSQRGERETDSGQLSIVLSHHKTSYIFLLARAFASASRLSITTQQNQGCLMETVVNSKAQQECWNE
jgi:hypothetical protein